MRWVWVLGLLALAGCQSEISGKAATIDWLQSQGMDEGSAILLANNKPALRQYLMSRGMAGQDDAYCRSLGAYPGTAPYIQCRTALVSNRPVNDPPPKARSDGPITTRCSEGFGGSIKCTTW